MKIGAKIFSLKDKPFLDKVVGKVDFIETMAMQGEDYGFLKNYNKKIVLHAEHQSFGKNPADATKYKENIASINFALRLADKLNAEKIIVHPGFIIDKNCSEEIALSLFKDIKDRRIIIENTHAISYNINPVKALCSTPESAAKFLKISGKHLCFDISHAIVSAILNKKKHDEFVIPFINLNPLHFHFSDVLLKTPQDHLSLGEGDLDIGFYKKLIPREAEVTLETAVNAEKLLNDIRIMRV